MSLLPLTADADVVEVGVEPEVEVAAVEALLLLAEVEEVGHLPVAWTGATASMPHSVLPIHLKIGRSEVNTQAQA